MVRTYRKTPGTRNYKNYSDEALEEAIEKISNDELSITAASLQYKIPFGTLYNKYKGLHGRTHGGQPVFSHAEEVAILKAAATCAEWGFPLTILDLRMFAKSYLDKQGKVVDRFPNNLPGVEWALSVLKRHKNAYGQRIATNIKRSRAAVGRDSINKYFDNIEREVEGIPASNIFNYDESNLSDDPGKKKCIYRRGVKYPEKVMNFSKSCTTVMICGSADGTLLPPYVIYKSLHLYDTWKERGIVGTPCCNEPCCIRGSRYNRTASGWIDAPTFRDWFNTCFLPHANRLEGKKVLIGDNLSSHLDGDVLAACEKNNISFICLVPNSTHLTQPLDVGFFRPMKIAWRKILDDWKKANLRATTVPKDSFPRLLKEGLLEMDKKPPNTRDTESPPETSAIKRNLVSSFKATGIFPLNREQVLRKLPEEVAQPEVENVVRDQLTDFLKQQRYGSSSEPTRKKKRLQVEPGKSVSTVDEEDSCERQEDNPSLSQIPSTLAAANAEDDADVPDVSPIATAQNNLHNIIYGEDGSTDCESDNEIESNNNHRGPQVGQFIVAKFGSKKGKKTYQYLCCIEDICDDKLVVQGFKSQKKTKTIFRAVPKDVSIIEECDIITYLPQPLFKDDLYTFPTDVMVKEL